MTPDSGAPRRLKVLIFVDHPIIVRHFVASGAFAELERRHDVRYVTLPPGHKRIAALDETAFARPPIRLPEHTERSVLWKRLFHVDQLRRRGDPHARVVADGLAELLGAYTARRYKLFGTWPIWPLYRRRLLARIGRVANSPLEALLDEFRPDAIVHPTVLQGAYIDDLIEAGRRRRVPTVLIMNSWDNPATKRAMFGAPDYLLVWGAQTERHAIEYGGVDPRRVVRFGAAQFDVYRTPPAQSRAEFRRGYGLAEDATLVLYAGSSKRTDEYAALSALEDAVEDGRLAGVAILYRPHPWGDCGKEGWRIAEREWRHVRIERSMADYVRRVAERKPLVSTPDYAFTRDVLANVDAVISPLSTILLEAALLGKPPLCAMEESSVAASFDRQLPLTHFQEYLASPVLGASCTRADLVERTRDLVARSRDPACARELKEATRWFVEAFDAPFAARFAEFLETAACGEVGLR